MSLMYANWEILMSNSQLITGKVAPLDRDQIMFKQFLRRIDKSGFDKVGLL